MRLVRRLGTLWPALLVAALWTQPAAAQIALGGDPRVNPADFQITTFASGLNFPNGMARLSDGSLLVATSNPTGGSYFASTAELLRFVDADNDGVADGPGTVMYSDLAGALTSLRVAGSLVFITSVAATIERISILRMSGGPAAPYSLVGSLNFEFPDGWEHKSYALAVRPAPGGPANAWELYFNVGSDANVGQSGATVGLSGLLTGTLQGGSIYRVRVQDTGTGVTVSSLTRIASGVRNAAGMDFHPTTGALYFEDNGIDGLADPTEPLSADELNRIAAADLGASVPDFGFPSDYIEYRTGTRVGSGGVQPLVAFQPVPPPNGSESEGASGIAFAPPGFPPGLTDGVFVGFHGQFWGAGPTNEENPVVFYDLATGQYFHFIESLQPGVGHLDSLLSTADALFVADLAARGDTEAPGSGVIYTIRRRPAAASLRVSITAPAEGVTVSGTTWFVLWVDGAAAGARTYTLSAGGSTVATTTTASSGPVSLPVSTTALANGSQPVTATVTDAAGNTGSAVRAINVQNAGGGGPTPLVASFTSPSAGATVSGTVTVGMAESGAVATPISFTLNIDGVDRFTSSGTSTTASLAWDTTTVANGSRTLTVIVRDGAGRTATATRAVNVQNAGLPPGGSLRVSITAPTEGATVSGRVWFVLWVAGAAAGTNTYTLGVGGVPTVTANTTSTGPVTLPIDTTALANGALAVTATVIDSTGNRGSAVRTVNVQNAGGGPAPLVAAFTSPSAGATVSGTVTVGMAESGAAGPPIAFTLAVDGVERFSVSGGTTTASFAWDTSTAVDGNRTLTLTVRDGAGRTATATRIVNVQNTAPPPPGPLRVSITAPGDGASVSGTTWFVVWVEGAAAGSKTYTLTIGAATVGSAVTASSGPVSIPVDTRGVANGTRTVTATVRDSAAAAGSATRTVTVQN